MGLDWLRWKEENKPVETGFQIVVRGYIKKLIMIKGEIFKNDKATYDLIESSITMISALNRRTCDAGWTHNEVNGVVVEKSIRTIKRLLKDSEAMCNSIIEKLDDTNPYKQKFIDLRDEGVMLQVTLTMSD